MASRGLATPAGVIAKCVFREAEERIGQGTMGKEHAK